MPMQCVTGFMKVMNKMGVKDIECLVRNNVLSMEPYSTARDEYQGEIGALLDANENPFDRKGLNRYPSRHRRNALLEKVASIKGLRKESIFLGNGSDESIDLCYRVFCNPGEDNAVIMAPSYGMYSVCADMNGVERRMVMLPEDFSLPVDGLLVASDSSTKLMFICSPNNPTGNSFPEYEIRKLLESFKGMLVLDEAYVDFSERGSMSGLINEYPNLIVLQTLSKAYGLAGLRIGISVADPFVIRMFDKVRYPYNIGTDTLSLALSLIDQARVEAEVSMICSERRRLSSILSGMSCITKVFPSDANFILVQTTDPRDLYVHLLGDGIIVRDRSATPGCGKALRLTVGTPAENEAMIKSIERYSRKYVPGPVPADGEGTFLQDVLQAGSRRSVKERVTGETSVRVEVDLDGNGESSISTGLDFFNHMLDQIPHHGGISLKVEAKGDLQVDEHHTVEDVAITLGEALLEALGDRRGIGRYGFVLPMDDCDAMVLMDLGGRIDFSWDVPFTREYVGDVPTEMFRHFFQSLCSAMKCNLHIQARGENNHHLAESVFKAFARTLRAAVRRDLFKYDLPSSKGVL